MCNRIKLGRMGAKSLLLLAIGASLYSCKDDYTLDNESPSWLGSSIYEYLDSKGNYTNFVKLIDDLNYKEVLSRTGSKTLFVANDSAFDEFYKSNQWNVHDYSHLTIAQKKLLLNSAMINNAYLLEMMSSTSAGDGDNDLPQKGQCLRRETALDVTDSIAHLFNPDIPVNYNNKDKDYWSRFRNNNRGIYLAMDESAPMMTHFLTAQLAAKEITDSDFKYIVGRDRDKNDSYVFDCKVTESDITCQNGYINKLDKVLITPQNIAEVLRTNGDTKLFSHLLDRFSAPFYNGNLTERYKLIYGNVVDSIFTKNYFSDRSVGGSTLYSDKGTDPQGNPNGNIIYNADKNKPLPYDPGWNTYYTKGVSRNQDMAAIFAPCDEMLMNYFFSQDGGGQFLMKAYNPEALKTITEKTEIGKDVYAAVDSIPLTTLRALMNNLMKESFNNTVPSKFDIIKNSAQDPMFDEKNDYHRQNIKNVLLGNNGVIYVMNEVTTPAEYAAVSAPSLVETDKHIFNYGIQAASLAGIPTNYYAYLLAMSSCFSFFAPNDDNFYYIDPLSFITPDISGQTLTGNAYKYVWVPNDKKIKATAYKYNYDLATGTGFLGEADGNVGDETMENRLKDMLETHTIIHEDRTETSGIDETVTGVEANQHYFISKNGAVIYVENAEKRKDGMTIKGGWGLSEDKTAESVVIDYANKSKEKNGYGNGFAYTINTPIIPTIESPFSVLYNNPNFSKFFELCQTDVEVLKEIGITSTQEQNRYIFFVADGGIPCYEHRTGKEITSATNVRFFNNFNYTIYVPDNAAMAAEEAKGLPTWQDLRDILELDSDTPTDITPEEEAVRNEKVKAMATAIVNFCKYHFQDNSIFADTYQRKISKYETATINSETGIYCKLSVASGGNGSLTLTDATGSTSETTKDVNIIARDYVTKDNKLEASSAIVMHGISKAMNYKALTGGRYDSDWSSEANARNYLRQYQLLK